MKIIIGGAGAVGRHLAKLLSKDHQDCVLIDEYMDPDISEEIYEYFRTSDDDNIKVAQQVLGDEYTREELRLIRIKFISEMGN